MLNLKSQRNISQSSNNNMSIQKKKTTIPKSTNSILQLQQIIGNRGVENLVQSNILQKKENNTGLPNNLKSGIESLSGYSMDNVKVHYNSSKPAQFNALAFAQGSNIHLAKGQEKHLPHEAWHIVQQKQGRVQPTRQMKGNVNINDDKSLEREADVMGNRAFHLQKKSPLINRINIAPQPSIIQRQEMGELETSRGIERIEGINITASSIPMNDLLTIHEDNINEQIDEWILQNLNNVASSLDTAAESFENWHSLNKQSNISGFAMNVIAGGISILGLAYPPAGIVSTILGAVVSIVQSSIDDANGNADRSAIIIEQAMINRATRLRNSSLGFGRSLKINNLNVWKNIGIYLLPMENTPIQPSIAKEELYFGLSLPLLNQDFTVQALTNMIHQYTTWIRRHSYAGSSENILWAIESPEQRYWRSNKKAHTQLGEKFSQPYPRY